jgi:hypothetical protein
LENPVSDNERPESRAVGRPSDDTAPMGAPDWERIEADYRAGILSLREIATKDGNVTEGAIRKRAKKLDWPRDLAARIRAKAEDLVRKEAVRAEGTQLTTANPTAEKQIIEANAEAIAAVRLSHRTDVRRARTLCTKLLAELEWTTDEAESIERLEDVLRQTEEGEDTKDTIRKILQKVISLPGRAGTMKALADSLKTLVGLEREAWGLKSGEEEAPDDAAVSQLVEAIKGTDDAGEATRLYSQLISQASKPRAAKPH